MAKKLAVERYNWFHGQVKAGHDPNARKLAHQFEISPKQAQRDIEFIRDRLDGPLVYIPRKKGYEYSVDCFELPPIWLKEEEFLALCLALRLSATLPDKNLKRSLSQLLEKFLSFRFLDSPPPLSDFEEKVSVKNIEYFGSCQLGFRTGLACLSETHSQRRWQCLFNISHGRLQGGAPGNFKIWSRRGSPLPAKTEGRDSSRASPNDKNLSDVGHLLGEQRVHNKNLWR